MFLAVAFGGGICTFLYKFPFDLYGERVVFEVRKQVFHKLLRLPLAFYDKK
jgi:ABC-type multidrug transport system fused ATPase/permease subunit